MLTTVVPGHFSFAMSRNTQGGVMRVPGKKKKKVTEIGEFWMASTSKC